jgi:zinc/manganese transport system substrate-binding protein
VRGTTRTLGLTLGLALGPALLLAGCGGTTGSGSTAGTVNVVASTNVYGDIVGVVGKGHVNVTTFISDPSQDPHSFEASTKNQLAISKAAIVVRNGGGYDDFVDRLLKASGKDPVVVDAVTVTGHTAVDGELNEHVWYDLAGMRTLATTVADDLAAADPADAAAFRANAAAFGAQLEPLIAREQALATANAGKGVAITEPVPMYMLSACGLVDRTPEAFSEAVEEGSDVSPKVLADTVHLMGSGEVVGLFYNSQTSGAETQKVRSAASDAGIAVVPVTETLPEGATFVSWMTANLDHVASALAS